MFSPQGWLFVILSVFCQKRNHMEPKYYYLAKTMKSCIIHLTQYDKYHMNVKNFTFRCDTLSS